MPVEYSSIACHSQANLLRRIQEICIPGDDGSILIAEFQSSREMNGVVATKSELFSEFASTASEILVNTNRDQIAMQILEICQCPCVPGLGQTTLALSRSQGCASLRVSEKAGRRRVGAVPECSGRIGALLDDKKLDQCRGVEVEDQWRCSATRFDTGPAAFTRACLETRGLSGRRMRPRRARSSRGLSPSSALIRAMRFPRRVMTISPPFSTCSK